MKTKQFEKQEEEEKAEDYGYWTGFKLSKIVKEYSAINHIDVSPLEPFDVAVTCSAKVQVFSGHDESIVKTSSRNKENVFGARFRQDGKLMVCGGESGLVQVLSASNRSILRNFKGHTQCCRVCCFSSEFKTVFTAADDASVRIWDVSTSESVSVMKEHKDFIRCGCVVPNRSNLFVTGSYDHTVKVWDSRTQESVMTLQHEQPVEQVLCYKTGGVLYSSGGDYIRAWDIVSGGKLLTEVCGHTKAVTAMCFDKHHTRLLTGALDRRVKVYDVKDYKLIANLDYPSSILSLGLDGSGKRLVVGMADGAISIKTQPSKKESDKGPGISSSEMRPGPTVKYNMRGGGAQPKPFEVVVHSEDTRKKISNVDRALRKYEFHRALDIAFSCPDPAYIVSVLIELSRQNRLKSSLEGKTVRSVVKILKFICKFVTDNRYTSVLIDISHLIIDGYKHWMTVFPEYDEIVRKLNRKLALEKRNQIELMRCLGALDTMMALQSVGQTDRLTDLALVTIDDGILNEKGMTMKEALLDAQNRPVASEMESEEETEEEEDDEMDDEEENEEEDVEMSVDDGKSNLSNAIHGIHNNISLANGTDSGEDSVDFQLAS